MPTLWLDAQAIARLLPSPFDILKRPFPSRHQSADHKGGQPTVSQFDHLNNVVGELSRVDVLHEIGLHSVLGFLPLS